MLSAFELFGLGVVEWAVVAGAAVYAFDRLIDRSGIAPSSEQSIQRLRDENEDLVRINSHLESKVENLTSEVEVLKSQVKELRQRDMEQVLTALATHDANAAKRFDAGQSVLIEIRDRLPSVVRP